MQKDNNILFIIPPYLPFDEYQPKEVGQKLPVLTPPYGVLSLISYINQNKDYNIEILDLNYEIIQNQIDNEDKVKKIILEKIVSFNPFFIGISALFNTSFPHLKYICPLIKQIDNSIISMVGGGLATNLYIDLFNGIPEIDICCYGEGELPLKKLLEEISLDKQPFEISRALITKESLQLNIQPEYDFIYNLDEIPIIDFSYIDLNKYNGRSYINKDSNNVEVSIHSSRGCPYNCCYCSNYIVHGKKIRTMSNEMFLNTVHYYIDNYKIHTLMIEDDHFLANKERAIYLLNELSKLNINIEFPNGIAVFKIDDDIAEALNNAGVKVLPLAIESGCEYVLHKIINKPLKKEQIYKAVKCLRKYDIKLHAFIVIGFPNEFDSHREETLDMLVELGLD
jgi:anaerobic magnesium-protoporphyrin IX monomethyl ester cyclase